VKLLPEIDEVTDVPVPEEDIDISPFMVTVFGPTTAEKPLKVVVMLADEVPDTLLMAKVMLPFIVTPLTVQLLYVIVK
jgi:hypothetical protein